MKSPVATTYSSTLYPAVIVSGVGFPVDSLESLGRAPIDSLESLWSPTPLIMTAGYLCVLHPVRDPRLMLGSKASPVKHQTFGFGSPVGKFRVTRVAGGFVLRFF